MAFAACLGIFATMLSPNVGHSGDSAELSLCARLLGLPHSTGYPLYLTLAHFFQSLVPVGSVAWRMQLLSAVFAAAAIAALTRVLLELRVPPGLATGAALGLAFTPTFWRHAIVAEVYSLHALLVSGVLLLFLRWSATLRTRDFYAACGLYAVSFGNHLLMVTLLPAIAVLVLRAEPRAFVEVPRLVRVLLLIALGASQYLLVLRLGSDPATPYRAAEIGDYRSFFDFVTGAKFHAAMFAFSAEEVLLRRLPMYLETTWSEFGPWIGLAPVGVGVLGRSRAGSLLGFAFLGNLAFALGYDISDLGAYFIASHLVAAVWIGVGLAWTARGAPRVARACAVAIPLVLAVVHMRAVERERDSQDGRRMRLLAEELGEPALVLAGYHDYQFLLYLKLVEGKGRLLHAAHLIEPTDVADYLAHGQPIELKATRERVLPGLPVYSAKVNHRAKYSAAGLVMRPWRPGIVKISLPEP